MTIGGDTYTLMITSFEGRTSLIIITGAEALGETSTGGGTEKLESSMIKSTNLRRVTLDGGMVSRIIKISLLTTWICLPLGSDTMRISLDFGDETERLLIG